MAEFSSAGGGYNFPTNVPPPTGYPAGPGGGTADYGNSGGGYSQSGFYGRGGGYSQGRGYSQGGGYVQRGGYNQSGGYGQRGGYNQSGGYGQRGGYSQNTGKFPPSNRGDYMRGVNRGFMGNGRGWGGFNRGGGGSGYGRGDDYGGGYEPQHDTYEYGEAGYEMEYGSRGGYGADGYGGNYGGYGRGSGGYDRGGFFHGYRGGSARGYGGFRGGRGGSRGTGASGPFVPEEKVPSDNQIFISGLPTDITEDDMVQFFGSIGDIKKDKKTGSPKIWIYKDSDSGVQKGEANLTYVDPSSAQSAITWFDGKDFKGNTIKVQIAMIKPRRDSVAFLGSREFSRGFPPTRRGGYASRGMGSSNDQADFVRRPGDWTCCQASCGNTNFAWRQECNKCQTPRPSEESIAGRGGFGYGRGGGPMRGGSRGYMNRNVPY